MPANCDASVNARPTPLWEHMTFSILLHENREIKGFLLIRSMGDTVRAPGIALAAAAVLALEAVALLVFAVIELAGLGAGDAASLPTALALIVLTLIGAAALVAFAVGTRSGKSWARSGEWSSRCSPWRSRWLLSRCSRSPGRSHSESGSPAWSASRC